MKAIPIEHVCTPSIFPGEVPATEESLKAILTSNPKQFDAHFALGFMQLREMKLRDAITSFKSALEIQPNSAEVRNNLGVAYLATTEVESALKELRKAVVQEKDFFVGQFNLARALESNGDATAAKTYYLKVQKNARPSLQIAALRQLVELSEADEKHKHLETLFSMAPESREVRDLLALQAVEEASSHFEKGENENGLMVLGRAHRKYTRSFSSNQELVEKMRTLSASFAGAEKREAMRSEYWKRYTSGQIGVAYELVTHYLFGLGLLPELWFETSEIDPQIEQWTLETKKDEIIPYASYRLGLALAYKGEFDAARKELESARDYMPKSKHEAIKVEEVIRFCREMLALHSSQGETISPDASSQSEWEKHGFKDAFQVKAWRALGVVPELAASWKQAGFSAAQAERWAEHKIEPEIAARWLSSGFEKPAEVKKWLRANIEPSHAKSWSEHFPDGPQMPIQCLQAGFEQPEVAARWMKLFTFPSEAIRWIELDFSPQDAALWLRQGISDPFEAQRQTVEAELQGEEE